MVDFYKDCLFYIQYIDIVPRVQEKGIHFRQVHKIKTSLLKK